MKSVIKKVYLGFIIFMILVFFYLLFAFRLKMQGQSPAEGYWELTAAKEASEKDSYSNVGFREIYTLSIDGIGDSYTHLMFQSIHQEVKVYVENVCIYSMRSSSKNRFGSTPGCVWNDVLLEQEYEGKDIRVEIIPVYKSSVGTVPKFYFGARYSIVGMILAEEAPGFLLSVTAILLGLVFIVYVAFNAANSEVNGGIAWLGAFALMLGVWKLTDGKAIKLLLPGFPAISMIPFIALMLGVIPLILFIKELYSTKEHVFWYIFCWMSIAEMIVCILLQYFNYMDFRETYSLTTAVIVMGFSLFVGMFIYEVRKEGWSTRLVRNTLSVLICFMGIGLDFGTYFLSGRTQTSVVGIVILLIYCVFQGYVAFSEARELTMVGLRAQNYEQMAYHDQLTGLFNRSALTEDTDPVTFEPEKAIMVMFDLNNLKKCNDSLGHDKGDTYIRDSAQLIQTTFKDFGKCYRTGGDEFCCLVTKHSLDRCKKQIELLRQKEAEYNKKSEDIHMAIACGYAKYDKRIDYDINDTARRADKFMYEDKERLKAEAAGE
ncbi:MAG: diguanylate cyclase [Roseburia sp.]|nr:diguanylate cyclase [Roseburia sp.]